MNIRSLAMTTIDPDGGYLDAVDDGNDLGELMLGPHRPYDLDASFTPAPRWASRQELVSPRHLDPAEQAVDGQVLVAYDRDRGRARGRGPRSGARVRRAPVPSPDAGSQDAAVMAAVAENGVTEAAVRVVVFSSGPLADRAASVGLSRAEAVAIQSSYAAHRASVSRRPARATTRAQSKRRRRAATGGRGKSRSVVRSSGSSARPSVTVCRSCDQPVRGIHCGCS